MRSKTCYSIERHQGTERINGEGLNWILIAGGALLGTLSVRVGCKIKQAFETKRSNNNRGAKNTTKQRLGVCQLHSNLYKFTYDRDSCYHCISGEAHDEMQSKQVSDAPFSKESDLPLPLVQFSASDSKRCSNAPTMWAFSSELLELPHRPFQDHNGSVSPSISESGSDIYTKRVVINKLRQQLKGRDEMIMEMQNQILNLQNSLCTQMSQSAQIQTQLDSANQDLFVAGREIQGLRKVVASHCISKSFSPQKLAYAANWPTEAVDCIDDLDLHCVGAQKAKGDEERVVYLKEELGELREAIERKDFLLQNYKEQKVELFATIKEMEQRLESNQHNSF